MLVNVKKKNLKTSFFAGNASEIYKSGFFRPLFGFFYAYYLNFRKDFDVLTKRTRIGY